MEKNRYKAKIKYPENQAICRDVVNLVNSRSVHFTDVEYRRLLGTILKRLYAIRNISYLKKPSNADFNAEYNHNRKKRLDRVRQPNKQ